MENINNSGTNGNMNGTYPPPQDGQPAQQQYQTYYYNTPGGMPYPNIPYQPPVKQKKRFNLTGKDDVYILIMTVLTVLFTIFGFNQGMSAGFTVTFDMMFIAMSIYMTKKGVFPGLFGCICGALSLVLSTVFFITCNTTILFTALFLLFCTSAVWFYSLSGRRDAGGELSLIGAVLTNSFGVIFGNLFKTMASLFGEREADGKKNRKAGKVLIGIVAAVPVAAVVVILLSEADIAFQNVIGNALEDFGSTIGLIFGGLILTPFVLSFSIGLKKSEIKEQKAYEIKGIDQTFITSFLSVISICYLIYLFSQLAYFFNAFKGLLPAGYEFSYSEYARRGFFELCGIAAINFCLVYGAVLITKKKEGRLPVTVKTIGSFISVFTLVIISTAIAKMFMYIKEYGMTFKRLFTSAFMIFLAVVFICLIIRLFVNKIRVLKVALVTAAFIIAALGIINIDAVIANYNYKLYTAPHTMITSTDLDDLCNIYPEGIHPLIKIAQNKDYDIIAKEAEKRLFCFAKQQFELTYDEDYKKITGFYHPTLGTGDHNISNDKAIKALKEYVESFPDGLERVEQSEWYWDEESDDFISEIFR